MEKVKWTDKKTNEEILHLINETRKIIPTVKRKKRRWIGHMLRHDNLLQQQQQNLFRRSANKIGLR